MSELSTRRTERKPMKKKPKRPKPTPWERPPFIETIITKARRETDR